MITSNRRVRAWRLCCWLLVALFIENCWTSLSFADSGKASQAQNSGQKAGMNPAKIREDFPFASPYFETVGSPDVIPYGIVTALMQDRQGLLWLGTQNGLIRYDGYQFKRLTHKAENPKSLGGDFVNALKLASDGKIWVGTFSDGLSVFDPETEKFENYRNSEQQTQGISGNTVFALAEDGKNGFWIGTDKGLNFFSSAEKSFRVFRHQSDKENSVADDSVRSLLIDKKGRLWVGSLHGLQRFQRESASFEAVRDQHTGDSLQSKEVVALFEARDGKIWLGTRKDGAAWIDPETDEVHWLPVKPGTPNALNHGWVRTIAQTQSHRIWLGSYGGGLTIVDANSGEVLQKINHDDSLPTGLALDRVGELLMDPSGLLWVGTWGGGLQKINANNLSFKMVRHSAQDSRGLSHSDIYSVMELKDGRILVGTGGNGIDILDRQHGLIGGYRVQHGASDSLSDGIIKSIAQGPDGTVWVGTQQAGAFRLDAAKNTWKMFDTTAGLPSSQVAKVYFSRRGDLWVGTAKGLAVWNAKKQRFDESMASDGRPLRFSTYSISEDNKGRIWVASTSGLFVGDIGGSGFHNVRYDSQDPDSLGGDEVTGLLLDSQNRFWVTGNGGLELLLDWDGSRARFEHVSATIPHPADMEFRANLLEDKQGRIWLSDAYYDPRLKSFMKITKADGFDVGTWWVGSHALTHDGLLLHGGTEGLGIIDSEKFQLREYQPFIRATELKINGLSEPLGRMTRELVLNPEQRNFSIGFSSLDYSAPNRLRYSYRLQGYDKNWIETDAEHRVASYGNLWPGEYTLEVRGSNRDGVWSKNHLEIKVHVLPAFWQTSWFLSIVFIVTGMSLVSGYRWRVASLRVQAANLQKLIAERTQDVLQLGEIGKQLTASLDMEETFQRVYAQVHSRLDATVFSIGLYDSKRNDIEFVYNMEYGVRHDNHYLSMDNENRLAVWCVRERRELIMGRREGSLKYVKVILPPMTGMDMESIVYQPLMVSQKVIGCFTVQSPKEFAYDKDQIEFLRVIASYTAIALSNSTAHADLAHAHHHLQETQAQLVQSEKMASLGQLVANVAHEINTPIGAVKTSGNNIAQAMYESLLDIPKLFKVLTPEEEQLFQRLISAAQNASTVFSSREERAIVRKLSAQLSQLEIVDPEHNAAILMQLQAHEDVENLLPLLRNANVSFILKTAENIASIINNTKNINLAVNRVAKLVTSLKSFVHNGQPGQFTVVDLSEGIEAVLTLNHHQIKKGVELIRDFDAIPAITCSPDELNQVWTNLIHNALQAMKYQGSLTISIKQVDEHAVVSIRDSGCGIPEEIRAKIYDAFFTTKAIGEGSGLGLNIVKKIIDRHHGSIDVQSEVGVGTTFIVRLPYNARLN